MKPDTLGEQGELFGLIWRHWRHPFRLRVNDIIRVDGRLCRIIRVTDCAAVVLMNQPARQFTTRFDKPVRFQPAPKTFRISPNAESEIVSRKVPGQKRRKQPDSPSGKRAANTNGPKKSRSAVPSPERRLV